MTCHRPKVEETKRKKFATRILFLFQRLCGQFPKFLFQRLCGQFPKCTAVGVIVRCHTLTHPKICHRSIILKTFHQSTVTATVLFPYYSSFAKIVVTNCVYHLKKIPSNLILFHCKTYKTETTFDLWILKKHWQEQSHIKNSRFHCSKLSFSRKNSATWHYAFKGKTPLINEISEFSSDWGRPLTEFLRDRFFVFF